MLQSAQGFFLDVIENRRQQVRFADSNSILAARKPLSLGPKSSPAVKAAISEAIT